MIKPVIIEQKISELQGKAWTPIIISEVNDQIVRLALFKGDYHWHKHSKEDELFFVYKGTITVKIKNQPEITVNAGELVVIPKGIEHCPVAEDDAFVLIFEPHSVDSKGD